MTFCGCRIKANDRHADALVARRGEDLAGALEAYHTQLDQDSIARSEFGRAALHDEVSEHRITDSRFTAPKTPGHGPCFPLHFEVPERLACDRTRRIDALGAPTNQ